MNRDFWHHLMLCHPDAQVCVFNPNIAFLPSLKAFAVLAEGIRVPEITMPFEVPERCLWYFGCSDLERARESVPFLRSHRWRDLQMPARGISGEIDWRPFMRPQLENLVPDPSRTSIHVDHDGNTWVSFCCGSSQIVFETLPVYLENLYVISPVPIQKVPLSLIDDGSYWLERVILEQDAESCRKLLDLYPTPLPKGDDRTRTLLEDLYELSRDQARHYVEAREIMMLFADKLAGLHSRRLAANDNAGRYRPSAMPRLLGRSMSAGMRANNSS